jgi:hypothetical protein
MSTSCEPQEPSEGAWISIWEVGLVKHHVLTKIPFEVEPMKAPQPHRAFVPIELEPKFFAAIDKSRNLPVVLAVRAMFWLGLRESEALEMR